MASRIFLAHAREDKARIRELYAELEAKGFEPWLDEEDLRAGQVWKTEIPKAIQEAGVFVACLSSYSVEKIGYVQNEFRLALSAFGERPPGAIFLVPVRLDDCEVPDLQIPDRGLSLRDFHWIDLWQPGGLDKLIRDLEHALGRSTGIAAPQEKRSRKPASPKAGTMFRDIDEFWCPELVVIPAGSFLMGSTEPERRWAMQQDAQREWVNREKPQHKVSIAAPFAIGKCPVTRGQFARFVEATSHDMSGGALVWAGSQWEQSPSTDWCSPGFGQTDLHPVVCLSWKDAEAYVRWLSRETGQPYRLLSEAEWEYACRAGTTTRFSWGDEAPTPKQANFGAKVGKTTEVSSYAPNPWGLFNMHGNVWEWVEDCANNTYEGAPEDGSAWTRGDCSLRVQRGGSWSNLPRYLRSAFRMWGTSDARVEYVGCRVARTLSQSESGTP